MESMPLLADNDQEEKSKLGNLLKANVVFLVFHLSVNIHEPLVTQYLYNRFSDEVFGNSTVHSINKTSTCYLNESDPGYILQEKVQERTSNFQTVLTAISSSLLLISCMFLGSYSDFLGRRFLFIVPLIGEFLRYSTLTIVICWNLDLRYMYIGEVLEGISGGYHGVILASYAYTADNTPPNNSRTVGIAVIDFTTCLSSAISQLSTGYFIKDTGFLYPCLTASSPMLLSVIIVVVLLPETINTERRSQYPSPVKAVKNVFGFFFSKDFGPKRSLFWLSTGAYFLIYFNKGGIYVVEYLFQMNQPFCWGPELIGYFIMAGSISRQLLGIPVIKLFHLCTSDPVICIITSLIRAGAYVLESLADTNFMLFAVVLPTGIASPLLPGVRAIMSRMAPTEMQGSLFAVVGLMNVLSGGLGVTAFNEMYDATVKIFRGFTFLVCAACHLLAMVFIVVFLCLSHRTIAINTPTNVVINDSGQ
ncbi:lysosomal proton-coupled steroid conjugate and bile acid symporter SLC46A3-like [Haliotis asinina]|uniref:lysosomal proton-coupled steroid conjugate and bile acid symporter SLC46A3-like n=1 Tax=Haliotis asinina TaxID=109174 RepID=UPI003531AAA7